MRKSKVRKRLAMYQHERRLNLNSATMIQNSQKMTIARLVDDINQCIDWEERSSRPITASDLLSNTDLPDGEYLAIVFGSAPKFIEFLHQED